MNKKTTKAASLELETMSLDFLSQVSGGASSRGKDPRDPSGFTTYIHPRTVWVTKTVRVYRGRPPRSRR